MKRILSSVLAVVLVGLFSLFALGSLENEEVDVTDNVVGDYKVDVVDFRLVKDLSNDVIIIKYSFTNNSDDSESFNLAVTDTVYQGGMSLTETYVLSSEANYDYDNKSRKIKSGATVEIEIAYKLEDTTTDIEVEIKDGSLFGDSDDVITKTFSIQ